MSFLDVRGWERRLLFCHKCLSQIYFSGVYSHFDSFIPISYKFGLVSTLIFRCFSICSDMSKFHLEVENLKFIFRKNGYTSSFIDSCIKKLLNKLIFKLIFQTVSKKELFIILPYLGKVSLQTHSRLSILIRQNLPFL